MDVDTLRQVIKTLEQNNKARWEEITHLQARVRSLKATITKLQANIAARNKEKT